MDPLLQTPRIDRRVAIKWMLTASASLALPLRMRGDAESGDVPGLQLQGYGPDPSMVKIYRSGDVWPLTFTPRQRLTAIALCDLIIPADSTSPSASKVGVPDFIDEWISAPYPAQKRDRPVILDGLAWMDAEANARFGTPFAGLIFSQKRSICDDLCDPAHIKPEHATAMTFFKRYRDLTAGGYYTTPEGMKAIGYVGNVPLATFEGPPIEVLKHLGLA